MCYLTKKILLTLYRPKITFFTFCDKLFNLVNFWDSNIFLVEKGTYQWVLEEIAKKNWDYGEFCNIFNLIIFFGPKLAIIDFFQRNLF